MLAQFRRHSRWSQTAGTPKVCFAQHSCSLGRSRKLVTSLRWACILRTRTASKGTFQGQPYYDFLVENTGCSDSSDTLECLRTAPYDTLKAAMNNTPSDFSYQVRDPLPCVRVSRQLNSLTVCGSRLDTTCRWRFSGG